MRRALPFLLLALLLLGSGLGVGVGLAQAPSTTAPRTVSHAASRVPDRAGRVLLPNWLMGTTARQLDALPVTGGLGPSSQHGQRGEVVHYAESAFHRASEAMGQPPFDLPSLTEEARVAREKVWLVVVTGEREYEDIAVVRWSGQTVPSGNAVEFAFDQSGVLLMSSASVYRGPAAAFLAPLGIRFAPGRPLPLGPAFQIRHPSPLVQQGHAGIGSCPAWSTEMTATANTSSFSQQQWFVVTLSAENLSKQSCTFVGSGPPARTQEVGPCGPTSLYVLNAEGTVVSPTGTIMCPLLQTVTLGPGRTLRAQGDWGIGVAVPDGRYTVVVAQTFRFSVLVG